MEDEEYLEPENFTEGWESPSDEQGSPASSYIQVQFVVYLLIALVGTFGNILVFIVMRRRFGNSLSAMNLLLVNLSVADLGVVMIFSPFYLAYDFLEFEWRFGLVLCKAVFSVTHLCLFGSLGTLVAIAVERYKIAFRIPMKKSQVKVALCGIWLMSLVLSIPQMIVYQLVELEGLEFSEYEGSGHEEGDEVNGKETQHIYVCEAVWPDALYEKILQPVDFVLLYIIPLVFIGAVYGKIIYRLRKVNARRARHRIQINHRRGAVNTMAIVVIVFALLNFPIHVFHMYRVFNPESWFELVLDYPWLFSVCVALVLIMHSTNPIIYGIRHGNFRRGVLALLARRFNKSPRIPRKKETPQTFLQHFQEIQENDAV